MSYIKKNVIYIFVVMTMVVLSTTVVAEGNIEYIVRLKSGIQLFSEDDIIKLEPLIPELDLYTTTDIDELNTDMFEFVEEDAPVELFDTYDYSPVMKNQEYAVTNIKSMWDIGVYGSGIRVGVIDSGCNAHEFLDNNLREGANFADNSEGTEDNIGHGTGVCGIIGAEYGNEKAIGMAHKVDIIPLKFIDCNEEGNVIGGTTKRLANAIISAVDDFQCDVINMSCGTIDSNTLKLAIDYAVSKGVIIVAAVGNEGSSNYNYPAAYDNVIGVGAVDNSKTHADFSNTNNSVFVTAPGEDVTILAGMDEIITKSGTSFSAPVVSGIIACMCEINPEIELNEVMNIISETAEDLGEVGCDDVYGYGLINANNIIEFMLSNCECFASKVDLCPEDNFNEVRFRINNRNQPEFMLASYNDGILSQFNKEVQYIGNDVVMIRLKNVEGYRYKYFVWDSICSMIPVGINEHMKQ